MAMKNIPRLYQLRVFTLAMALLMASCVKENYSDCQTAGYNTRLVVRTLAEETSGGDNGQIDNMLIYIFDGHGRYVTTWVGGQYTYGQRYAAELDLEPGKYQFIVWTNLITAYAPQDNVSDPSELVVSLQYPADKKVSFEIPDLHHGILTDAVVKPDQDNDFLVILRPNTYTLNFSVEGLVRNTDDYSFTVTDNNTHYSFDNNLIDGMDDVQYVRTVGFTGDKILSSMKVLRLADDRSPDFDFSDHTQGKSLHTENLVQIIQQTYLQAGHTVNFDTEFVFDITLRFDSMLSVEIWVNGWRYEPNETDL